MPNCFDVAKYILEKKGLLSPRKFQTLVYFSQAWHLAWFDEPLFKEPIQAWMSGPMVPALYEKYKGIYVLDSTMFIEGTTLNFSRQNYIAMDKVLDFYSEKDPDWVNDWVRDDPWNDARRKVGPDNARGSEEISPRSMTEYYSSL